MLSRSPVAVAASAIRRVRRCLSYGWLLALLCLSIGVQISVLVASGSAALRYREGDFAADEQLIHANHSITVHNHLLYDKITTHSRLRSGYRFPAVSPSGSPWGEPARGREQQPAWQTRPETYVPIPEWALAIRETMKSNSKLLHSQMMKEFQVGFPFRCARFSYLDPKPGDANPGPVVIDGALVLQTHGQFQPYEWSILPIRISPFQALGNLAATFAVTAMAYILVRLVASSAIVWWRRRRHLCATCGYDVHSLEKCPECGTEVESRAARRPL
jgi:hypothetical protein